MPIMSMDAVVEWVRSRDKGVFEVFSCQGREPTEADVRAFEAVCGFALPQAFREYTMSPFGGTYIGVDDQVWPPPKPLDVGPFWTFLNAVKVFGIAEGIPEWLDLREQYQNFKAAGFGHLVPFLQVQGDADCYCFNARGQIIQWRHEEPEDESVVDIDCMALILREIHALAERVERRQRGEHLRM
jgi:hypothetical protein